MIGEIILTKEDNDIFLQHIESFNANKPIAAKVALDSYIHKIVFYEGNISIDVEIIKPQIPNGCTEHNIGSSRGDIGTLHSILMSELDPDLRAVVNGAIREIKVNRCLA